MLIDFSASFRETNRNNVGKCGKLISLQREEFEDVVVFIPDFPFSSSPAYECSTQRSTMERADPAVMYVNTAQKGAQWMELKNG